MNIKSDRLNLMPDIVGCPNFSATSTDDISSLTFSHQQTHIDNALYHINTANDDDNDNDSFPVLESVDETVDSTTISILYVCTGTL
jgi:hypothetical protein